MEGLSPFEHIGYLNNDQIKPHPGRISYLLNLCMKRIIILNFDCLRYERVHFLIDFYHPQLFINSNSMIHILKRRSAFSTSLRSVIKNKTKEMKEYDEIEGIKFEKHLRNLVLEQKNKESKTSKFVRRYEQICLGAAKPMDAMLKDFLNHSKAYTEEDLVEVAVYMSKAFQLSIMDNEGKLDLNHEKLYDNPNFDHFIEELKYALSSKSYISNKNLIRVLRALVDMKYPDIEVMKLVMRKIEDFLNIQEEERIEFEPRLYQIEKKGYYNSKILGLSESLLKNDVFLKNLAYFEQKKKFLNERQLAKSIPKGSFENDENFQNLINLLDSFNKFNEGAEKFVESIIAIRQQYYKMSQISHQYKVLRNPSLNFDLLQIEEKLLETGLITIHDVKTPEKILDGESEAVAVEKILNLFCDRFGLTDFEDLLVTSKKKSEYQKRKKQNEIYEYSQIISTLIEYVTLPCKLHGASSKVSLLSVRWQRYFLENKEHEVNLNVEKIFLRSYAETHVFLMRHLPLLEFSMMGGTQKAKMHWLSGLLSMGYYEDAMIQFRNLNLTHEIIKNFNSKELLILVKILNSSFEKGIRLPEEVEKIVINNLKRLFNNLETRFEITHHSLCDIINYLYQIGHKQTNFYDDLIAALYQEVTNYQINEFYSPQELREAHRILMLERKEKDNLNGLLQSIDPQNFNPNNPFYQVIQEVLRNKGLKVPEDSLPFILTGLNDKDEQTAIYLVPADSCSIHSESLSGHIWAFCRRVYEQMNIVVTPISINRFIYLQYANEMGTQVLDRPTVKMIPIEQVVEIFNSFKIKNEEKVQNLIRNLSQKLGALAESQKFPGIEYRAHKIVHGLKNLAILRNQENNVVISKEFYARRAKSLVNFTLLKRDLNLLKEKELQKLNEVFEEEGQSLSEALREAEEQIESKLPPREERFEKMSIGEKNMFKGKRLSLDVLEDQEVREQNVQIQLIDLPYILDSRYVEYNDWKMVLRKTTNLHEIKLDSASQMTKLLASRFCPNSRQSIVCIPSHNSSFYAPQYPLNWKASYSSSSHIDVQELNRLEAIKEHSSTIQEARSETNGEENFIIAIQNFKHELKSIKSPEEICQYILSFEFIDSMLMESKERKERKEENTERVHYLERDPREYFNFLERKKDKMYLESPFLEYIFEKIERTEEMKQKIQDRKTFKVQAQMLFKRGSISKKQYFDKVKEVDEQLINDMKGLKKKLVGHVNGLNLMEDPRKIVQLQKNIEDLEQIVNASHFYDQNTDEDLVLAGGNYSEALKRKRVKAETNLVLFKIFMKEKKKEALSQKEQRFLSEWRKEVQEGITSYKKTNQHVSCSLKKLSGEDKQRIVLHSTNILKNHSELALSDFILEINHFLEEGFLTKMEGEIYAKYFQENKSIPANVFQTTRNHEFNYISHQIEKEIFEKNSKFTQEDIEQMIGLTNIFKTEGVSSRHRYGIYYQTLKLDLQAINQQPFRNPLMKEYLRCKDQEFYSSYLPGDVMGMKEREVDQLWTQIFQKQIEHTTSSDIRRKVSDICQRLIGIKMSVPPYFGNLVLRILSHKRTDVLTKQKLIAHLELFKIPLHLDSQDLMGLVEARSECSEVQLMKQLRESCAKNNL